MNAVKIEELKKAIKELPEDEAKTLLFHALLKAELLTGTDDSETQFIREMKRISNSLFERTRNRSDMIKEDTNQLIHILFGDSPAGSLKVALKEMGLVEKEKVISFWDIFSIGPVWRLDEKLGQEERFEFVKNVMNDEYDDFQDYQRGFYDSINLLNSISEDVPIQIWVAENAHEQTGLRYVLHLLKDKKNDIKVINTTKMYSEHVKRTNTVLHTGEIMPEELQVIYKQSYSYSPLTAQERKQLEEEWSALMETKETLRIWRDGQIMSISEDYYDEYMIDLAKRLQIELKHVQEPEEFIKSARLIGEVIGHLDQYIGDKFFEYRLRKLIGKDIFEMEGNLKAMRYYSVRLRQQY